MNTDTPDYRNMDWSMTNVHMADGSCQRVISAIHGGDLYTVEDGTVVKTPLRDLGIEYPVERQAAGAALRAGEEGT